MKNLFKNQHTLKESRTDWLCLEKMTDEDIDFSDIPELDADFFKTASVCMPKVKHQLSIHLDQDVVAWFKNMGKGYQTLINAILKTYIEAHTH